jgi:hypothetical protein
MVTVRDFAASQTGSFVSLLCLNRSCEHELCSVYSQQFSIVDLHHPFVPLPFRRHSSQTPVEHLHAIAFFNRFPE